MPIAFTSRRGVYGFWIISKKGKRGDTFRKGVTSGVEQTSKRFQQSLRVGQNPGVFIWREMFVPEEEVLTLSQTLRGFPALQSQRLKRPEVLLHTKQVEIEKRIIEKRKKGKIRFLTHECRTHSR